MNELLEPLYEMLREYMLMMGNIHTDNIPVQTPGMGKMQTGRLSIYMRDDRNASSVMPEAV
ncbi:hypothetical protein IBZ12_01670 [Serratia ureilytica]